MGEARRGGGGGAHIACGCRSVLGHEGQQGRPFSSPSSRLYGKPSAARVQGRAASSSDCAIRPLHRQRPRPGRRGRELPSPPEAVAHERTCRHPTSRGETPRLSPTQAASMNRALRGDLGHHSRDLDNPGSQLKRTNPLTTGAQTRFRLQWPDPRGQCLACARHQRQTEARKRTSPGMPPGREQKSEFVWLAGGTHLMPAGWLEIRPTSGGGCGSNWGHRNRAPAATTGTPSTSVHFGSP